MAERTADLRALLMGAGVSPENLARRINQHAAELGLPGRIDLKTPYKWLRGTKPRRPWPVLTVQVLNAMLSMELSPVDFGWDASDPQGALWVPADSGLSLPWTGSGALAALSEITGSGVMERRNFLSLTGNALTAPALDWLIAVPAVDIAGVSGHRVQETHVDAIEQITSQFRRMDDKAGGGSVLDLVGGQARFVAEMLKNYSYDSVTGTRLHAAAAELLRLAGWLSFDAGRQAMAQRYWLGALRAAHAAGDRAIGANVLGFMSCQAQNLGRHNEAIRLAEAARQGYPGASPQVAAILGLRAAQAYARAGESRACREAADSAYSQLRDGDANAPDWAYWLDEAQANEQIGYCYLRLEQWGQAQGHLRTAIRLRAEPDTREGVLTQTLLALAYARQGEHERACEVGSRAADTLASDVNSPRCVSHLRNVQSALSPYRRAPVVADFTDRVNTLFGVPA